MLRQAQMIRGEGLAMGWRGAYKRGTDIAGALVAIGVFGVPMVLIALAIKVFNGGPVLYRQRRISLGGREFWMLKFRTMVREAEAGGPAFAAADDPRCTRLGRWLRANSLDELPQLFNVLAGEMSLVGPRPERPELLPGIEAGLPGFGLRLQAKAGITGFAQIHGFRGNTSFRKRLQYDLYYLRNWSPGFDLKILWGTVFGGFRHNR